MLEFHSCVPHGWQGLLEPFSAALFRHIGVSWISGVAAESHKQAHMECWCHLRIALQPWPRRRSLTCKHEKKQEGRQTWFTKASLQTTSVIACPCQGPEGHGGEWMAVSPRPIHADMSIWSVSCEESLTARSWDGGTGEQLAAKRKDLGPQR